MLPKVTLKDVPKYPKEFDLKISTCSKLNVYHHNNFTNGVVYFSFIQKLPKLSIEDQRLVKLFCSLLPNMGNENLSYTQSLKRIQRYTGGVSAYLDTYISMDAIDDFCPKLVIHSKALSKNKNKLLEIINEMVFTS